MKYLHVLMIVSICGLAGCETDSESKEPTSQQTQVVEPVKQTVVETPPVIKKTKPASEAYFQAALNGDLETVQTELVAGVDPKAKNPNNQTALMLAAFNGQTSIVELLLSHGASINVIDNAGRSALLYAASGPNEATVKLLLDKGADINVGDKGEHWTPLMFAASEGQTGVVQVLLEQNADWTMADTDGETALVFAKNNGHLETAKLIETFIQSKATQN